MTFIWDDKDDRYVCAMLDRETKGRERNVDVFLDFVVGDKPAGIPQWNLID